MQSKGRGWDIHCSISLVNVSLPAEEGGDEEHRNDQWREDVGGGPSLGCARRNGEDEEDDSRCVEYELMTSQRHGRPSDLPASVAIPKTSKRALEIGLVDLGMRMKHVIPIVEPMIAVK